MLGGPALEQKEMENSTDSEECKKEPGTCVEEQNGPLNQSIQLEAIKQPDTEASETEPVKELQEVSNHDLEGTNVTTSDATGPNNTTLDVTGPNNTTSDATGPNNTTLGVTESSNEADSNRKENISTATTESSNDLDSNILKENVSYQTTESTETMETDNTDSTPTPASNEFPNNTGKQSPVPTGLGLLAQYNSDSEAGDEGCEEDDVVEVPASRDYRNKVVEIESDSDSESSSSDSDVEYLNTIRKEIEKTIDFEDDEDEDDDGEDGTGNKRKKKQTPMRVKGEMLLEDLPPIQDLHITVPEEECVELGRVHSIIDQLLLVSVKPDSLLLDLDTVLFLDKGKKVLGEVFDVLGQVADPMYCVRFNSHKEIEEKVIKIGDTVYVAPKTQYTQFIILSSLMKLRGSDASWENDVEPPPRYLDYSDDEQEREARARLRNKDRPNDHQDAAKRSRANNDDNDDDTASISSIPSNSSSISAPYTQRSGRFNRDRVRPARPHNQYQRYQAPPQAAHSGSWHSNYRQPYSSYQSPHMMPQQMPNAMPSPYQCYPSGPFIPPPMSPIPSPALPPMYVLNPLAVPPPGMMNNRSQYNPAHQQNRYSTRSPPPAPPGLD